MQRRLIIILFVCAAITRFSYAQSDLTGYWVSLVTEDWRWRMMTPPKGDYTSVPINAAGRSAADGWDPAKDAAEQCKAYGAAAIMRIPGRLHITQPDANTIRIDTDAGNQTRLLHLGGSKPPAQEAALQGYSVATDESAGGQRGGNRGARPAAAGSSTAQLKVVTTGMRPGYLRKNGVPYSANAVLTEYFTRFTEADGQMYLVVMSIVEDPQFLTQPFITSTHFRKERDGSAWNPQPCLP